MSWSDHFPIIDHAEETTTVPLSESFQIAEVINRKDSSHLVVTSLYRGLFRGLAGKGHPSEGAGPDGVDQLTQGDRELLNSILGGTRKLTRAFPDTSTRVYLDGDLEFLISELVDADCEVDLMKSTSDGCCTGSMWRFLALQEPGRLITIVEASEFHSAAYHASRTRAASNSGLGGWRVPLATGATGLSRCAELYRPIRGRYFGSTGALPIEGLLALALEEHGNGTSLSKVKVRNNDYVERRDSLWPDPGFDEWFLLTAVYPRMAERGLMTFIYQDEGPPCYSLLLDIEYVTWAHPGSEIVFYQTDELTRDHSLAAN